MQEDAYTELYNRIRDKWVKKHGRDPLPYEKILILHEVTQFVLKEIKKEENDE